MKLSPAELKLERGKVQDNKFNQYVKRITLKNVRGFDEEIVEFKTPVTALIGTNGGGKSTILGAVASLIKMLSQASFSLNHFMGMIQ